MATASISTNEKIIKEEYQELVTKTRDKVIKEEQINLVLSRNEAETLKGLLGQVGGNDCPKGHRLRIDAIYNVLRAIGITSADIPFATRPYILTPLI